MNSLELADYAIIVSFTTILTTASTSVLLFKMRRSLEKELLDKINDLFVRVGILEAKHR